VLVVGIGSAPANHEQDSDNDPDRDYYRFGKVGPAAASSLRKILAEFYETSCGPRTGLRYHGSLIDETFQAAV